MSADVGKNREIRLKGKRIQSPLMDRLCVALVLGVFYIYVLYNY